MIISWLLALLKTGLYILCFVFRYSEILIASALYVAFVCNKPLSSFHFSHGLSESALRWCNVYTCSNSLVFLSFFSNLQLVVTKLCLNARTTNAPVAVILFLAFSSNYIIILNVPVYFFVFLSFVDIMYLHLTQYVSTCLFSLVKVLCFCVAVKYYILRENYFPFFK